MILELSFAGDYMVDLWVSDVADSRAELVVIGLFDGSKVQASMSKELDDAISRKAFSWDFGKYYTLKSSDKRTLIISMGKPAEFTVDRVRRLMATTISFMKSEKIRSATVDIALKASNIKNISSRILGRAVAEGATLSDYVFDKYVSVKKDLKDIKISLEYGKDKEFLSGISEGKIIASNTNYAKDLVNEPAVVVTPKYLSQEALKLSKDKRIKVTIFDKKALSGLGCGCLLAVGKGSDNDPKLIIIEYNNNPKAEKIAIVGKGLTFDAGGYDIKTAGQFSDMKCDMSGAAAVLGTIKTAMELDIKINIVGAIPTCENLINGTAMKPGDIIKAYNGKTIEIKNTDAEGRLVLADAISYVEKNYSPKTIIDLATLTGACVVAFGRHTSGIVGNDESLVKEIIECGIESYDRVWPLPFYEEYQDNMDGDITDLKNMSNKAHDREGGAITGGVFLSKFVGNAKWTHIDIAGPAFLDEARTYNQKYGSGAGVRLLSYYLMKKG